MKINYTTGYAGTGKSTRLLELLPTLPDSSVVLCPTHKAIQRLGKLNLEVKTIHALLGWIPTINEQAKNINHIDTTAKMDRELDFYTDIVIDEAGMMSEEMFFDITSKLEQQNEFETDHITLHLFLDPYQLLPVKGKQIEIDPLTTTNLTTQYRAESPDVVALFTKFVNYLEGTNTKDLTTPYSENVRELDITKFKVGDRLLAYTNKAVGEWNKRIAEHLGISGYEGQEVQLGSMLETVTVKGFLDPSYYELRDWYDSGEVLQLQNSQISKQFIEHSLKALLYHPEIHFIQDDEGTVYPVIIGIGHANLVHKQAKEAALENRSKFKDVYALGRAYTMDYSFATTVHKSQGSEFDTVFVDKLDIQKSIFHGSYVNYARLMYVSISRAKQLIYI